jgi:hypothetical protein
VSHRTPPATEKQVIAMVRQGIAQRDIAAKVGISKGAVSAILARDLPQLRQRLSAPKTRAPKATPSAPRAPSLMSLRKDGEALAVELDSGDAYAVLFDIEESPQNLAALVIFVTDDAADYEPDEGETPDAFKAAMVDIRKAGQARAVALLEGALAVLRKAGAS